jgi:hypothetical protein
LLDCSRDSTADAEEGNVDVVVDDGARKMVLRWILCALERQDGLRTYVALSVHVVPVPAAGLTTVVPRSSRLGRAAVIAAKRATRVMTERIFGYQGKFSSRKKK